MGTSVKEHSMLEIKDLTFSVKGKRENDPEDFEIIKGINLTIEDDQFTVITGPNGGGKSTLAKLIMGVEDPTSGQILFNGVDITHMPIHERAKLGIGYGFQQPARFKGMTVRKLLSIAAGEDMAACECNDYLTRVGLCSSEYLNREVDKSLSGGELKRIEIATILAADPKLAIYDEPEAGIDLWSFQTLTQTFRQIHEARDGRSIVIISHQERIIDLADQIILLRDGRVEKQGAKDEMLPELGFQPVAHSNPDCVLIPNEKARR
jgi:Fe-S cluster assembly ATP-binding protein